SGAGIVQPQPAGSWRAMHLNTLRTFGREPEGKGLIISPPKILLGVLEGDFVILDASNTANFAGGIGFIIQMFRQQHACQAASCVEVVLTPEFVSQTVRFVRQRKQPDGRVVLRR